MKHPKTLLVAAALVTVLSSVPCLRAPAQSSGAGAPDNSKQNQAQNQTLTADNQSNAKGDRMTTAKVRRTLMADKTLSTYGHNVKIIVAKGQVTLKGPVRSDQEKEQVGADAASVVTADRVTNQITVKH